MLRVPRPCVFCKGGYDTANSTCLVPHKSGCACVRSSRPLQTAQRTGHPTVLFVLAKSKASATRQMDKACVGSVVPALAKNARTVRGKKEQQGIEGWAARQMDKACVGSVVPALAKNARTGHPQHRCHTRTHKKGSATRPKNWTVTTTGKPGPLGKFTPSNGSQTTDGYSTLVKGYPYWEKPASSTCN